MGAKMLQRPAEPYLRQQAPEVYGALSGLMGTAPDEQGSVLDPNTARARAGAEIGFPLGTALQMMPFAKPAAAGVKALGPTAGRMAEGYLQRTGGILPLDVYHGSPYKFDAFDASKIGSGEGAQVYGHGLYFAEVPEVAKGYQATLGHKGALDLEYEAIQRGIPLSREARIEFMRQSMRDMPPKIAVKNLQNANIEARSLDADKLAGLVKDYKESKQGSLYKVDLPDEKIAKMLDYDKPLSEQHPDVRAALMDHPAIAQNVAERAGIQQRLNEQYPDRLTHPILGKIANREIVKDDITGREIYEALSSYFDDRKAASQYLNQQGIPGIKYLDEGSRNLANTWIVRHPQGGENVFSSKASAEAYLKRNPEETLIEPKVTRNFVTFPGEEKNLTILERNGQPSRNSLNSFIR
jgi:hypothetical protein